MLSRLRFLSLMYLPAKLFRVIDQVPFSVSLLGNVEKCYSWFWTICFEKSHFRRRFVVYLTSRIAFFFFLQNEKDTRRKNDAA